jgi:hypothetical protein
MRINPKARLKEAGNNLIPDGSTAVFFAYFYYIIYRDGSINQFGFRQAGLMATP